MADVARITKPTKPLMTYKEWFSMSANSEVAIIPQLLPAEPGEFMAIIGRTGIGKTILTTHLGFSLATGSEFYGFPCQKVRVGHLAMEGGKKNIRDRFIKIASQYPEPGDYYRFELRPPMPLPFKDGEEQWHQFRMTFEGCQVVILDNLRQVLTGKWMDPDVAAAWIKRWQEALRNIQAVGIYTHHVKKPQPNLLFHGTMGDVYEAKGPTEYVDSASTVILLERKPQGRERGKFAQRDSGRLVLYFAKARIQEEDLESHPLQLRRNFEKASFDWLIDEQETDL